MSYSEVEALVLTELREVSNFSASNTSRGDWGILAKGTSVRYAVLRPGAFERDFIGTTTSRSSYVTIVELFYRFKDDVASLTGLEADMQAVVDKFDASRQLGDSTDAVLDALVRSGGDVQEQLRRKIKWLMWPLRLEWSEEQRVTFTD